ncbi:MAG: hypothetical protein AAF567_18080 [Actinomycetota bacterium]
MTRNRLLTSIAAATAGVVLLGACGGASISEFVAEQAIESSADGDFDIDFSDGGFSFNSEDGSGTVQFDEDGGFVFDTEDGSGSFSIGEDGGVVFETTDGSGGITIDEDGSVTTENPDNNTSGYFGVTDVPDDWPALVGIPQTFVQGQSFFSAFGDGQQYSLTGILVHDPNEPFATELIDRLMAAGYMVESDFQSADTRAIRLISGATSVHINAIEGNTTVAYTMES